MSERKPAPIYNPEPMPGQTADAATVHPFGVYERARINSMRDKTADDSAQLTARTLPRKTSGSGISSPSFPSGVDLPIASKTALSTGKDAVPHPAVFVPHGHAVPQAPEGKRYTPAYQTKHEEHGWGMVHHLLDIQKSPEPKKDIDDILKAKFTKDGVIDLGAADVIGSDKRFREQQEYTRKVTKPRVDPAVMTVARRLATSHYSQNYEGKVANHVTGELHPPVEASKAHKNPIAYLKTTGMEDPVAHIEKHHVDELRPPVPPDETRMAQSEPLKPFKKRGKEFMEAYSKNPLKTFGDQQKPAEVERVNMPAYKQPEAKKKKRMDSFMSALGF